VRARRKTDNGCHVDRRWQNTLAQWQQRWRDADCTNLQLDSLSAQLLNVRCSCLWGKERVINHQSKFLRFHYLHPIAMCAMGVSQTTVLGVMATLRFSFGTMGSGKSTLALQIHHNMSSRGVPGLLLTKLDRDGSQVTSRLGVSAPAIEMAPGLNLFELAKSHMPISFIVCDEAQFYSLEQCDQLAQIVDELNVDVFAFGLITDFRGFLFEGTKRMLEIADQRVEMQVEARCWCGERANNNARLVNGQIVYEGETVVVGDTDKTMSEPLFGDEVRYELLCRKHYIAGDMGPATS
jgi:thymidine kinase